MLPELRALLKCPLHSWMAHSAIVPIILFSFNFQMKIQLQLEKVLFLFSRVHNHYLVREQSCICVKANFFKYFKLSSLGAITALHDEPFMFQYPERGA